MTEKVERKEAEGKEEENEEEEEEDEDEEERNIHVKFVINKVGSKVLFAEAGSDFVDALLSFLLLPLGTIVKVLEEHYKAPVIGRLVTLYNGIANLDSINFLTEDARSLLLNPTNLDEGERFEFDGDFTESTASFIISDDLRVMPSVEGSVLSTLTTLGIDMADMDGVETRDEALGYNEIVDMLLLSLSSSNPLTAFLLPDYERWTGRAGNATNLVSKKAVFMNPKKMILKAMMQKSTNKLLFAEAHDDFVSFLFGLLAIPLGRAEWYLHSNTGVRPTKNLHRSIADSLYGYDVMTTKAKDLLFKPALSTDSSSKEVCNDNSSCSNEYIPLKFDWSENRYHVRGSRMYMVLDDLTVAPLSITSSASVIKEMKVSLSDVKEVELQVGLEEGVSILGAALASTTALTDGLIKPILKNQTKQQI